MADDEKGNTGEAGINDKTDPLLSDSADVLDQMKDGIEDMVKAMTPKTSLFNRATSFWSKVPIWAQVLIGLVILVPALVIGIYFGIIQVIAVSVMSFLFYSVACFLIHNHQKVELNITEKITAGLATAVDILKTVMTSLEVVCEEIANEIAVYQHNNTELTQKIVDFDEQLRTLNEKATELSETESQIHHINKDLQLSNTDFKQSIAEQKAQLAVARERLAVLRQGCIDSMQQMGEKIAAIERVKTETSEQLDQISAFSAGLKVQVEDLVKVAIPEEESRVGFLDNFNTQLGNTVELYERSAARMRKINEQLSGVKKELGLSQQRYAHLLCQSFAAIMQGNTELARLEGADGAQEVDYFEVAKGLLKDKGFFVPDNLHNEVGGEVYLEPRIIN